MKLSKLLKAIGSDFVPKQNLDISSIACDSRRVKKGSLFVAIDGVREKGSSFIDEAQAKGAACVIASKKISNKKIPIIYFNDTRAALAKLAGEFFAKPSEKIRVAGVTGTNGKTTVTYFIDSMLREAGLSAGILGTIGYVIRGKKQTALNTTPGALELQSLMKDMVELGCDYCIMEVSSHGLSQKRIEGVNFSSAIFTNLTHDHLDYHGTLENYFLAKAGLFSSLYHSARAIVNLDSPFALRLKSLTRAKFISYGIVSEADVKASNLVLGLSGSSFALSIRNFHTEAGEKIKIDTPLVGRHNILNLLSGIAWGISEGIDSEKIWEAVKKFKGAQGRLEGITGPRGVKVFIDYAHTPDALENVLSILRKLSKNLTVIFGCGGERDRLKRPLMGQIAEKYADCIIITSDNPRGEEPDVIAREITAGIRAKAYRVILNRQEAISYGLKESKSDCVLIAGKGHEDYQVFKNKKIEFNDKDIAEKCLNLMK